MLYSVYYTHNNKDLQLVYITISVKFNSFLHLIYICNPTIPDIRIVITILLPNRNVSDYQ